MCVSMYMTQVPSCVSQQHNYAFLVAIDFDFDLLLSTVENDVALILIVNVVLSEIVILVIIVVAVDLGELLVLLVGMALLALVILVFKLLV